MIIILSVGEHWNCNPGTGNHTEKLANRWGDGCLDNNSLLYQLKHFLSLNVMHIINYTDRTFIMFKDMCLKNKFINMLEIPTLIEINCTLCLCVVGICTEQQNDFCA